MQVAKLIVIASTRGSGKNLRVRINREIERMNITINLSQLVTGAVSSAVNGVSILIASRYFSKALEKVEKKAVNGKLKE